MSACRIEQQGNTPIKLKHDELRTKTTPEDILNRNLSAFWNTVLGNKHHHIIISKVDNVCYTHWNTRGTEELQCSEGKPMTTP